MREQLQAEVFPAEGTVAESWEPGILLGKWEVAMMAGGRE